MWRYFRYFTTGDLLCAAKPNQIGLMMIDETQISSHEYFQLRSIEIPLEDGKTGDRQVEFRHRRVDSTWRKFVECNCEILHSDYQKARDICVDGKVVNLSRGVGGDKSFFVYRYDKASTSYNVVAHICF